MEEKKGIVEILEVIAALRLIGMTGAKVMADGKIGTSDFGSIMSMLTEYNVLVDAVKGIKDIGKEIKDVDEAELMQLGTAIFSVVKDIKEELK